MRGTQPATKLSKPWGSRSRAGVIGTSRLGYAPPGRGIVFVVPPLPCLLGPAGLGWPAGMPVGGLLLLVGVLVAVNVVIAAPWSG